MKKPSFLSLFWKFTIAILTIVALFGYINLFFINNTIYTLFEKEINYYGINNAKGIADNSVSLILYDDIVSLDKMVSNKMKIDSSVAYIIVLDEKNKVLAHTFNDEIPHKLLKINNEPASRENIVKISDNNTPNNIIRDMAVPILEGNLGKVRIGIYEEDFVKSIHSINNFFLLMVILFLIFGVIGAFLFSYVITYPLKKIRFTAENLNLKSFAISENVFEKDNSLVNFLNFKTVLNTEDEIDVLTKKFNEMVERLQITYTELNETQISLIQAEKMASLGTLSAGLTHEINNPIAGIKNCMRRIAEAPENIKQNIVYIELMEEAVGKIEKVVGGLLNFTRKPKFEFTDFNLVDVIENVLLLSSFQLEKSRIAIVKNYANLKKLGFGSQNHIEQVILNLVLNSIDAIDERKLENPNLNGELIIGLNFENDQYILEISDNGIGIAEESLKAIFDPFFTLKKIKQGTGLGLSVCYNIIEQHDGSIDAQINSRGGMTFKVYLPTKKEVIYE
ncbi:MAG: ATP-binding protein [Lutibacter sp.]